MLSINRARQLTGDQMALEELVVDHSQDPWDPKNWLILLP